MGPAAGQAVVFGRFEADAPNERWVGDALHGPKVAGRKVYLFAFLDDHSRLAVGYRFGFAEDTVRLAAALEPALAARGVPGSVYVDYADPWVMPTPPRISLPRKGSGVEQVGITQLLGQSFSRKASRVSGVGSGRASCLVA